MGDKIYTEEEIGAVHSRRLTNRKEFTMEYSVIVVVLHWMKISCYMLIISIAFSIKSNISLL